LPYLGRIAENLARQPQRHLRPTPANHSRWRLAGFEKKLPMALLLEQVLEAGYKAELEGMPERIFRQAPDCMQQQTAPESGLLLGFFS
jgi:hypothetical protein